MCSIALVVSALHIVTYIHIVGPITKIVLCVNRILLIFKYDERTFVSATHYSYVSLCQNIACNEPALVCCG